MEVSQEPLPGRSALVLYGSETGNAQDVAEEIGRLTERLRFSTQVVELDSITLKDVSCHTVVLFAISTTGQGDLPANAQTFWKRLRSSRLPVKTANHDGCLHGLHFASFGLGDSSYPQFNWAHRKLYKRLIDLGANDVCSRGTALASLSPSERGESDEQHPEGVDGSFIPWSLDIRKRLLLAYPLPDGIDAVADHVLLRPKWELQFATDDTNGVSNGKHESKETPVQNTAHVNADEEPPPDDLLPLPGALTATIEQNERVTPTSHWQDVRHLKLTTSPMTYEPGDVLTIYPKNYPSDVGQFLAVMNWTTIADRPIRFAPTSTQVSIGHSTSVPPPIPPSRMLENLTLRTLLTNYLDILSIPRRSFFSTLAYYTTDEFQRDRLLEFTSPDYLDELYDYTTRPRRSILEVLQEFESVKIPWQRVCSVVPIMRGRQFSIASGGSLKGDDKLTRWELLIAIVKYKTVIMRIRQGVCTRYIASLNAGQQISVTLQRGSLGVQKEDVAKPVVMIGPGTGVAPMRSLIWERRMHRSALSPAADVDHDDTKQTDMLLFGCRNENADFFFKDEWARLQAQGALNIFAAFSRDQKQKFYVQDLVRKEGSRIFQALYEQDGIVYICGSSSKMPRAVREALIEVIQQGSGLERAQAEAYLARMEREKRYKQETW